jgi:DNA-binding transcriptional LysR family regulator
MIQRACARAGFVPRLVARATDFTVLLSLVAAGAGVTLVPALAARRLPPRVRLIPPAEPVNRRIFTVSRRGLSLAEDLAVRDENPAVLAGRPAPPGPGQPLQVVPGGQAVLHRPVAER